MKIKEEIKYCVSFDININAEDIVDKYIPHASFYRGHSIICDSEELAIEYVKHITKKIISSNIIFNNHPIDRVVNELSKKVDDFTTYVRVNWSGLKGNKYDFDVRSDYFDDKRYQCLFSINVCPHYTTMVVE